MMARSCLGLCVNARRGAAIFAFVAALATAGVASAQNAPPELLGGPNASLPTNTTTPAAAAPTPPAEVPPPAPSTSPAENLASAARQAPARGSYPNSGPAASTRIGMGYNLCLDAQGGLREESETRAPSLILWPCDGLDNQNAVLAAGALLFGPARDQIVRPLIAPLQGCDTREATSGARTYVFRICAGESDSSVDASDPARTVFTSYAPPGLPDLARGAPLVVDRLSAGSTAPAQWEIRRGNLIALTGANLCVMAPSKNVAQNAPLYLDLCDAPYRINAFDVSDDARRGRATFIINWRF